MRTQHIARPLLAALALALAAAAHAQTFTTPRPSPGAKVTQTVGLTDLSVAYSRPGVKGRAIWGGLVPYGKPWRTGANESTQFTCSDDIQVEGQRLPAGSYAIATVPGRDQWTVAFSTQKNISWGVPDYDPAHDTLRVTVRPDTAQTFVERMQFTFENPTADSVTLTLRWETLAVPLHITVDTKAKTLASARIAIAAAKPDDWRTPYRAAAWAFDAGVAPDETAQWARAAAKVNENFQTSALLARLAAKAGDTKQALALMKKSIAYGKADTTVAKDQLDANVKQLADWSAKK
jgi:hypothetical protein